MKTWMKLTFLLVSLAVHLHAHQIPHQYEYDNENDHNEYQDLLKTVNWLKEKYNAVEYENFVLKGWYENMVEEREQMKSEMIHIKRELSTVKENSIRKQESIASNNNDLKSTLAEMKSEIRDISTSIAILQEENVEITDSLSDYKNEFLNLKTEMEEMECNNTGRSDETTTILPEPEQLSNKSGSSHETTTILPESESISCDSCIDSCEVFFEGEVYRLTTKFSSLYYISEPSDTQMTWNEMEEFCRDKFNGHLPSIHSDKEADMLRDLRVLNGSMKNVYTGLRIEDGDWTWSDRSPIDWTLQWNHGQPNYNIGNWTHETVAIFFYDGAVGIHDVAPDVKWGHHRTVCKKACH